MIRKFFSSLASKLTRAVRLVTLVEALALVVWLSLVMSGSPLVGALVLFAGLTLEHFIAFRDASDRLTGLDTPKLKLVLASLSETLIWVLWLVLASQGGVGMALLALIVLFALMFVQHNVEVNILTGAPTFHGLIDPAVLGFTAFEAVGGAVWLALVQNGQDVAGVTVLVAALLAEHVRQAGVVEDLLW